MNKYELKDIINILQKALPRLGANLQLEHELYADYGLDSREFIYVIREIELEVKHDIDDEDLLEAQLITLGDLLDFLNRINDKFNVEST